MRVVVLAALAAVAFLASVVPVSADLVAERLHVDESPYLMPESACVSSFCILAADPDITPRVFLDAQSRLDAARLTLTSDEPLPPGVEAYMRLDCDPSGPACAGFGVEVHGALPLRLEARGLSTPPGAVLRIYTFTRGGFDATGLVSPHDSLAKGDESARRGHVVGALRTVRDTSIDPGLAEVHGTVDWDGSTAPCIDDPEPCQFYPAGHAWSTEPLDGPVTSFHATVTWTPDTPASQTLSVEIQCFRYGYDTPHQVPCQPWPEGSRKEGTSPLAIALDGLQTTQDSYYAIVVRGPAIPGLDPESVPVHQAYHVDGDYVYVVPA